jgi:CBS domain containing-hemolysin-like protein
MTALELLVIVLLVLVNGFFVAAEFALVSVRPARLGDSPAARLARRQSERLDEYLSACQLGITIASLALGALGEPTIAHLLEPLLGGLAGAGAVVATIAALLVMTTLHITAGEQAPKSFAIGSAERVASLCAYPLEAFYRFLRPLVLILNAASNGLVRLLGGTPAQSHAEQASLEEIRQMIRSVAAAGDIDRTDRRMLQGVFTLDERSASDVMTPRPRIVSVTPGQTVVEALRATRDSGHSRFPLVEDEGDPLLGLVLGKDLTRALLDGLADEPVERFRHDMLVAPPTQPLDVLLARLKEARASICAVLDEYGRLDGLVTVEDVVEELVGEIWDEDDLGGDIRRLSDGTLVVRGDTPLVDLLSEDVDLGDAHSESVGGLIQERLGSVPRRGDRVSVDHHQLEVLATEGRRIKRVLIRPVDARLVEP